LWGREIGERDEREREEEREGGRVGGNDRYT